MPKHAQRPEDSSSPAPLRVALYRRVSTGDQVLGHSLAVQRRQTMAHARGAGWVIIGDYVDPGVSGTTAAKDRPGLKRLLGDVRRGAVDVVLVAALDRLARTTALILDLVQTLGRHTATLVSCSEPFDTRTPTGRYLLTLCAARVQLEYETLRARTAEGQNERALLDGDKGGNLPFGYVRRDGRTVIHPAQATIVRRIYALKRQGKSQSAIARALNDQGVATGKGGARWYPSSVREVLQRRTIYRGGRRGTSDTCWPTILAPGP